MTGDQIDSFRKAADGPLNRLTTENLSSVSAVHRDCERVGLVLHGHLQHAM